MASDATTTPAPMRSWPRIAAEGWVSGISARRETTEAAAMRAMEIGESVVDSAALPPARLLGPVGDQATLEVVGRDADGHAVALDHADPVLAHLAVQAGEHLVVLA